MKAEGSEGLKLRTQDSGSWVGFEVWCVGCRVQESGFRVWGLRSWGVG